jgi:DNA-binding MarR family transcriptional regulator
MAETGHPIDLDDNIGHLLRRAAQHWSAVWADCVDPELTLIQFVLLRIVDEESPLDQRTLGERAMLDKSTCGYLVERLHRRALLDASIDPANRRRKIITLTPEGRELLYGATPAAQRVDDRALAHLSTTERAQLADLLRRAAKPAPGN